MNQKNISLSEIMITDVVVQSEDTNVEEATLIMTHTTIGALIVVDNNNKPIGIFTERDIVTKIVGKQTPKYTQLKSTMTREIITMQEDQSVLEASRTMDQKKIRHIIITDSKGGLRGIVSIRDINKALLKIIDSY